MKIIKLISTFMIAVMMLVSFTGCSSSVEYEPMELVPEGSEMLGGMKVSEALRDWQIYCELDGNVKAAEWFDTAKEEFYDNTGIDLGDISEIVMFGVSGDATTPEELEYAGIIMTGNFADKGLIDRIEEKTGSDFTPEEYGNFTLYTNEEEHGALVKISNTMMILGTESALKDCIDVAAGNLNAVSGTLLDNYNDLGDVMMKLSMIVPDQAMESFTSEEEAMMPVGLQSFADIEILGVSCELGTKALTVKTKVGFTSSESAVEAAEAFETLLDLFTMMIQDEEASEILGRIEITSSASVMHLTYEMTLSELADILEEIESGEGFPLGPSMIPGMNDDGISFPPIFGDD